MQWEVLMEFKKEKENDHRKSSRKTKIDSKNKEKNMTQRKDAAFF